MFAHAGLPPPQKQQIAQALPSSSSPDAYMSFPVASRFKISMSTYSNKAAASRKPYQSLQHRTMQPSLVAPWIASRSGGIRCALKRRERPTIVWQDRRWCLMQRLLLRARARFRDVTKPLGQAAVGALTIGMLRTARYFDPIKTADMFGRIARSIGPMMREQKIGRSNLAAAFPEKSPAEIEAILAGVWDNLGRVGAEFAHLDGIWQHDPEHPEDSRIEIGPRSYELFTQLRLDGKPALIFTSHLANWELPALAAVAHGLDTAILYRRPNIASADYIIQDMRAVKMGTLIPAGRDAPLKLAEALKNGQHVGMLVDQYLTNGVEVTFFGRKTKANPMLARLLRQIECPIHGVRVIRLPGHRFRAELSEEVKPVRNAAGQIDIQGTTQAITSVIEGWIREYPDQWLWLHRRWR
jgi:Kdo2-lipid IVA lauroyltransferase/acyltransferase